MGEPSNFRIPEEPTSGTPPTNFLLIALPRDADDLMPRAYTIDTILGLQRVLSESQITDEASTIAGLLTGELAMKIVRAHETEPWVTLEQNARYQPVGFTNTSGRLEFRIREFDGGYYFGFNVSAGDRLDVFERDLHAPAVIAVLDLNDFTEYFRGTVAGDYVVGRGVPVDFPDNWESLITAETHYNIGISQAIPPEDVVSLAEIQAEIEDLVAGWARTANMNTSIPQNKFADVPIARRGSIEATAEDVNMNDGDFRIQTISSQKYLKFYGLSAVDEAYLRSWEPGSLVEFVDNGDEGRDGLAVVNGEYDETNGLPIDTETFDGQFSIDYGAVAEYTIYSTQPQPIRLVAALPDADDALQNQIYAILNADNEIVGNKGYVRSSVDVTAFFSFSISNMLNGHRGYSTVAIAAYNLPQLQNSPHITGIDAFTNQFTSGEGNRWIIVFPTATTLVDADTTQLFLYTESGGDRITLNRDTSITHRVLFASDYDGGTMHTISAGGTLEVGVWKDDNKPLIEASATARDSYLEFDLRPAVGY